MKMYHAEPKGEMDAGDGVTIAVDDSELALGKNLSMIFELLDSVGLLGGVNPPANLDNGPVIRGFHEPDAIVGWEHGSLTVSVTASESHPFLPTMIRIDQTSIPRLRTKLGLPRPASFTTLFFCKRGS
jgi:hypothetical protein